MATGIDSKETSPTELLDVTISKLKQSSSLGQVSSEEALRQIESSSLFSHYKMEDLKSAEQAKTPSKKGEGVAPESQQKGGKGKGPKKKDSPDRDSKEKKVVKGEKVESKGKEESQQNEDDSHEKGDQSGPQPGPSRPKHDNTGSGKGSDDEHDDRKRKEKKTAQEKMSAKDVTLSVILTKLESLIITCGKIMDKNEQLEDHIKKMEGNINTLLYKSGIAPPRPSHVNTTVETTPVVPITQQLAPHVQVGQPIKKKPYKMPGAK